MVLQLHPFIIIVVRAPDSVLAQTSTLDFNTRTEVVLAATTVHQGLVHKAVAQVNLPITTTRAPLECGGGGCLAREPIWIVRVLVGAIDVKVCRKILGKTIGGTACCIKDVWVVDHLVEVVLLGPKTAEKGG